MRMSEREWGRQYWPTIEQPTVGETFEEAVARWLRAQPHLGRVKLPRCAEAFGLAEYGLRNRLLARGQHYQDLLDMERLLRLERLLREEPRANGVDAAQELGFSCGDVFRKWYQRHYGVLWKNREVVGV